MAVVIGLLAFLVLLSCAVILRERKLRRGWQRVLGRVLLERGTHERNDGLRSDGAAVAGAGVPENASDERTRTEGAGAGEPPRRTAVVAEPPNGRTPEAVADRTDASQ